MKLNLTNQQIAKIRRGQNVQIKPHQVGCGMDFDIHPSLQRKINSSVKSGRGFRAYGGDIMMYDEMDGGKISANRILKKIGIKKDVNQGIKKAAPVLRAVNQGLKTAGLDSIQEVAITQAVDLLPIPSIAKQILAKQATNQVDKLIEGAGIKKAFNRGLKKVGIKKDFYDTVNKKNINRAINYGNDVLSVAGYEDDLQNMAIKRITKDDKIQKALRKVTDDVLYEGEGGAVNPYLPTKYLQRGGSIRSNNALVYNDKSPMLRPRQAGFKAVPVQNIDSGYNPTRYRNAHYGKKPYYGEGFKN